LDYHHSRERVATIRTFLFRPTQKCIGEIESDAGKPQSLHCPPALCGFVHSTARAAMSRRRESESLVVNESSWWRARDGATVRSEMQNAQPRSDKRPGKLGRETPLFAAEETPNEAGQRPPGILLPKSVHLRHPIGERIKLQPSVLTLCCRSRQAPAMDRCCYDSALDKK
jgi:hypothetical protein